MHHLRPLLDRLRGCRVLVVGDLMLDEYLRGDVSRISPEAPVPVLEVRAQESRLGGAANAAANIQSLGGVALLVGVVGKDETAATFGERLSAAKIASTCVPDPGRPTSKKTRLVAQQQQIVRVDHEKRHAISGAVQDAVKQAIDLRIKDAHAVVISDYAKGVITPDVARHVIATAQAAGLPVVVDPKQRDFTLYAGATVITPNLHELEAAALTPGLFDVERVARELLPVLVGAALHGHDADGGEHDARHPQRRRNEPVPHRPRSGPRPGDRAGGVRRDRRRRHRGGNARARRRGEALPRARDRAGEHRRGDQRLEAWHVDGQRRGAPRHPRRRMTDRLLRLLTIAAAIGLGARGIADPSSVLAGGVAWLAFLLFVVSGWGFVVARIARVQDPDVGMRALWGIAGYLAVSGPLLAAGVLSKPVILALIGFGALAAAWREWTTDEPTWQRALDGVGALRQRPALALFGALLVALVVLQIVGAVATLDRNPWDDDIAYTPLVKRLLDAGNLIEPFSFRRLGAYGGQSLLGALAGVRGTLANVQLIDKGLCYAIALLLLVGYARTLRTQPLWLALVALVVVLMPDTAINTASYWSGVAMFVGLYRCVVDERWGLAGLVGAAACTLRQNYVAIAVVFLGLALSARLIRAARTTSWRAGWTAERRRWALAAGVAGLVLVPYLIAAYRSNGTFLFPFIDGTWNPSISLRATAPTWTDELQFLVWCFIETHPIVVIPSVLAVMMFATDPRPTRPITALLVASTLGLVLMVHSFVGSDANHLWRYAFAAAVTLLAVFSLETGSDDASARLVPLGRWVLLASLLLQLVVQRETLPKRFVSLFDNIREARSVDRSGDPGARAAQRRYAALQAAIPAGESVAVMLDDPAYLDYHRNQIFNLDTPGYASPGPGMPAFAGADALRAYLRGQGIRFVAFVRSDRSRYFYRRPFWVWRIFNDAEIFQTMSAYAIDMIETLASLSTRVNVAYEEEGLVVLDLGAEVPPMPAQRTASPGSCSSTGAPTIRPGTTRCTRRRAHQPAAPRRAGCTAARICVCVGASTCSSCCTARSTSASHTRGPGST